MRRWRVVALQSLIALALAGCGSTEPDDLRSDGGLAVRLVHTPRYADVPVVDGVVRASCQVTFEAIRRTELQVGWSYLKVVYYADAEMRERFDSTAVAGDSVARTWDGPVTPGNRPRARWTFATHRPFYARGYFRYRWGSTEASTPDFSFHCAPESPGGSAGPSVSNLRFCPTDTLEPAYPITLRYLLRAPAGSWQETIRITGACDTVVSQAIPLETSIGREAVIGLPYNCRMGGVFHATVRVSDVRQRAAVDSTSGGPILMDRSRPTLTGGPFLGEFGVGKDLLLNVIPNDGYRLARVVWLVEPYGFRDSVNQAFSSSLLIRVKAQPGWLGPVQVKLFARDSVGLVSDTLRSVPDSTRVFPVVSRPSVIVPTSGQVRNVLFDTKRNQVYVLQTVTLDSSRVMVLSGPQYTTTASYPVQPTATTMDITQSQDTLLIGSGSTASLGIIDLTAASPVNQVYPLSHPALPTGDLWNVLAGANGKAYVGTLRSLVEVNLPDRSLRLIRNEHSYLMERSGDGTVLLRGSGDGISTIGLMRPGETAFFATLPNKPGPRSLNRDGSRVNLALGIYDGTLGFIRSSFAANVTTPVDEIRLSPDGTVLTYLDQDRSGLIRSSVATGFVLDRTPLPFVTGGNTFLRYSPDGTKLVVGMAGRLILVDLAQAGGVNGRR